MIWRESLFAKLLLVFLGFGALMTATFIVVMRVSHDTYHLEFDQTVNRDLAREYVARNLLVRDPPLTARNFAGALRRITEINPDIDAYVLDARGEILAASAGALPTVRQQVSLEPIRQFLNGRADLPLLGDDPTDSRRREVFTAAPLAIPNYPAAYLYIVLQRRDRGVGARQLKTVYAVSEGVGVLLVAVVLAVVGSLLFLRLLTRRLGVLQKDIEQFRNSRFIEFPAAAADDNDSRERGDEIERLRRLFMTLAGRIRSQMQELQSTDEMRRELLANISHDLRTPLTTLLAHLETLLHKEDLSAEERQTFLAISVRQSQRLIRLVEQLLELARLDAGQLAIAPEPFQLAELAHDVVMKFKLSAQHVMVTLGVEHPERVPLVSADIALIEHVLDNLIENALRYAAPGGAVTVCLKPGLQTVRVEVKDTGPGIPESERDRIFDRFYRSDKSRPTGSGHSGLGLAIVRRILELHGQSVDFVTTLDCGTTFFFELPMIDGSGAARGSLEDNSHRKSAAG